MFFYVIKLNDKFWKLSGLWIGIGVCKEVYGKGIDEYFGLWCIRWFWLSCCWNFVIKWYDCLWYYVVFVCRWKCFCFFYVVDGCDGWSVGEILYWCGD